MITVALSGLACGERPDRLVDEIVIGARGDEYAARPERSTLAMYPLNANVCEPLVRLRSDYSLEPLLATHWEFRGNNTWRFHLRPGVLFSDGRPLTSESVRWTVAVNARREPHTHLYEDSVTIIDDLTVDLTPRQTNLRLPQQLVHPNYGLLAPGSEPANGPIGTGPYKFAGYRRDEWLAVERNDRYRGELAKTRRLTFRFLPDDATRVLSLAAGEVDLILEVPRGQAARLASDARFELVQAPLGKVVVLFLNSRGEFPWDLLEDRDLRRAIAMSIDRRALVEDVLDGRGELVSTLGPPAMLGESASLVEGIELDRAGAERLLESRGWLRGRDGVRARDERRLALTLVAWPEFDSAVLEFLQGQLGMVGVEVKIERFPDNLTYTDRINRGAFDLDLEGPNQNDGDPLFLPSLRFYGKSPIRSARYFSVGAEYDQQIERIVALTDRLEIQRGAAEAMRMIVDDDVVAIPLAGLGRLYAARTTIKGLDPHPSQLNQDWSRLAKQH